MSSSDPKGAYSRFIPREELGSFAAWQPGTIDGSAREPRAAAADVQAQVQAAQQAGYQAGYRDGLAALDSFKRSFANATTARVGAIATAFDAELLALEQQIAAAVADCATQLARAVVRVELSAQPGLIAKVADEAVGALMAGARQLRVHLHPDDVALVADGAGEAMAARDARLVADGGVARGGCRVESDIGVVDATVEMRWARACAAIAAPSPQPSPAAAGEGEGAEPSSSLSAPGRGQG